MGEFAGGQQNWTIFCGADTELQEESAQMQKFSQRDGHLFFKGQFVINPTCSLKSTLLQEFHNSKIGGHLWVLCTFKRLSQVLDWLAMKKDVETYVSSCEVCQKIRMIVGHPRDYSNHFLCRYKCGKISLLTSLMAFLTLPEKTPLWWQWIVWQYMPTSLHWHIHTWLKE